MLLHDSYFLSSNATINKTYDTVTIAYSPLFHSRFTLIISIFGFFFNLICCIKIWFIIYQYQKRKLNRIQQKQSQESIHILSHKKYRFLFILTSNDILLCFSSIISCLDEQYFFQSFLARHHLCSAHILLWKFTLHFVPLLIIVILCRYHYILSKEFQVKSSHLSTLKQLLCTDLSILIPFVLALAWSVDGLWLWGVANIKDYIVPPSSSMIENQYGNETKNITIYNSMNKTNINMTSIDSNLLSIKSEDPYDNNHYLMEQKKICYLQTNHNFNFTVRLVHLIQADFLLLFSLHLTALVLETVLHIRLCCCIITRKVTSSFTHERQICIYILYIFTTVTLTSIPFYCYRAIEIIFDTQLISINNEIMNSRIFSQILLFGTCFKPLLFFILFCPSSILFKLKCYSTCYSSENFQIMEQNKQILSPSNNQIRLSQRQPIISSRHHRYSLFMGSSCYPKFHSKLRTQSNQDLSTSHLRQDSVANSEHYYSWLQLTHSIIVNNNNNNNNNNNTNVASNMKFV
ncbi:unnamed protein product [Rotaria sordida]|uniref:G-protein coupled receptors family 3 profile domain-containing protein n=1 Tax=Rotaria sordida TaxID=392033 RepID=A0A814ADL2_9BILA|nr:unnamed protein product [Rotaria sordida]CAF0893097.1 unnamed protein product [Rotaria sordida]CAF0913560.1 unnamed protein product [Rotaria sordida]CAF3680031.1 unnamed protein product [Rotaria sordida]